MVNRYKSKAYPVDVVHWSLDERVSKGYILGILPDIVECRVIEKIFNLLHVPTVTENHAAYFDTIYAPAFMTHLKGIQKLRHTHGIFSQIIGVVHHLFCLRPTTRIYGQLRGTIAPSTNLQNLVEKRGSVFSVRFILISSISRQST